MKKRDALFWAAAALAAVILCAALTLPRPGRTATVGKMIPAGKAAGEEIEICRKPEKPPLFGWGEGEVRSVSAAR